MQLPAFLQLSPPINRNWLWLGGSAALGLAVALLVALSARPVYQARAALEIESTEGAETGYMPAEPFIQTQLQLLASDTLLLKAAVQAGLPSDLEFNQSPGGAALASRIRKHLTVHREGSSRLIQIEYSANNPKVAADFVNALMDSYAAERDTRVASVASALTAQLRLLQSELEESETNLAVYAQRSRNLADPASKVHYDGLLRDTDTRRQLYESMLSRAKEHIATGAIPQNGIRVVDRAEGPVQPLPANRWAQILFGLPTGLLGGLTFVVARSRIQKSNLPTADLPAEPQQKNDGRILAISHAGNSSTHPEIVLDFAETLAAPDRRLLIIDCEMNGALTSAHGLTRETGFSDFFFSADQEVPAWKTTIDGVSLMPAGRKVHRIPAMLARPDLRDALAILFADYDQILLNVPPILASGELHAVAPVVDGVVLVAPRHGSSEMIEDSIRQVREYGGTVLGLVEVEPQLAA